MLLDQKGRTTRCPPGVAFASATVFKRTHSCLLLRTGIKMFLDFAKLDAFDFLRAGILIAGFTWAFLADKKGEIRIWQLVDAAFNGLYGLGAFFSPELILGLQTDGKLDTFHLMMGQFVGGSYLALAAMTVRQVQSKDRKVSSAWLLARVLGSSFILISDVHGHIRGETGSQKFNDKHVMFGVLAFSLIWLGSVGKLWQHHSSASEESTSSTSKTRVPSVLNQHLLFSMILSLPDMIMAYGMPGFSMEYFVGVKFDIIHTHLIRVYAVAALMFILQEISALEFEDDSDKRDIFLGRFVLYALLTPLSVLFQYKHAIFSTSAFLSGMAFLAVLVGNAVCAAFLRHKEKKQ